VSGDSRYRLIVTAMEIQGRCPVFKVGDKMVVDSPRIVVDETDNVCIHALGCILSMIVPLSHGISFKVLGLSTENGHKGFFRCLDPGTPYTNGGTVLFEILREEKRSSP